MVRASAGAIWFPITNHEEQLLRRAISCRAGWNRAFCETNDVYVGEQKIICEPNNQLPSTIIKIIDEDKYQLIDMELLIVWHLKFLT